MNTSTLPQPTINEYQMRATQTRSRRQAKGMYTKPTPAQDAAYRKSIARGGDLSLTAQDCQELSQHPWLTVSQRIRYAERSAIATTLDESYLLGRAHGAQGCYNPPSCTTDAVAYDAYIKGWNDLWAAANNVTLAR